MGLNRCSQKSLQGSAADVENPCVHFLKRSHRKNLLAQSDNDPSCQRWPEQSGGVWKLKALCIPVWRLILLSALSPEVTRYNFDWDVPILVCEC